MASVQETIERQRDAAEIRRLRRVLQRTGDLLLEALIDRLDRPAAEQAPFRSALSTLGMLRKDQPSSIPSAQKTRRRVGSK